METKELKHFCIDIDNVVAATDEVMRKVIADYTSGRVQLAYQDVKEFNYYECRDTNGHGITSEEWKHVHQLFSEPPYLWMIRPVPDAVDGLRRLAERATLHIATSRQAKARRVTVEWLENYGFPAHDLHFLRHGEKHASLRVFAAAVEDDYKQAVAFATASTPCFLLKHPWNELKAPVNGVQWVADWAELTEKLMALTA